jgi:hypothetical protein
MSDRFQRILSEWTEDLPEEEAVIKVFQKVRNIPYGVIGSRDPVKVLEANKGTCSGKHMLLAALYRAMGMKVKDAVAFHRYENLPRRVEYPDDLKAILKRGDGIPDYHNFIKLYSNGKWLTLDATFEEDLRECFVVNHWDGKSNTKLSVEPIKVWEVADPVQFKITKLKQLSKEIRDCRREFLDKFSVWLDVLRQ